MVWTAAVTTIAYRLPSRLIRVQPRDPVLRGKTAGFAQNRRVEVLISPLKG